MLDNDYSSVYRARLQLVPGSQPQRFELAQAEELVDRFRDDNATFDQSIGKLNLSFINVFDTNGPIFTYAAELHQVPDAPVLIFELTQSTRAR